MRTTGRIERNVGINENGRCHTCFPTAGSGFRGPARLRSAPDLCGRRPVTGGQCPFPHTRHRPLLPLVPPSGRRAGGREARAGRLSFHADRLRRCCPSSATDWVGGRAGRGARTGGPGFRPGKSGRCCASPGRASSRALGARAGRGVWPRACLLSVEGAACVPPVDGGAEGRRLGGRGAPPGGAGEDVGRDCLEGAGEGRRGRPGAGGRAATPRARSPGVDEGRGGRPGAPGPDAVSSPHACCNAATSAGLSGRTAPGFRLPSGRGPIPTRTRRTTSSPTRAHISRI